MPRFAKYDEFGGPEVLQLVEVDRPVPGPGQVLVRVRAAGLNPVDYKIFHGDAAAAFGAEPPTGVGNDFAGVVEAVGEGVEDYQPGDRVFGGVRNAAVADYVVADLYQVLETPEGVSDEVAAALWVAGRTAVATVGALGLDASDTVLVSAAAGGVGVLASQLAVRTGATVLGTAGADNHEFLSGLGVVPVSYEGDLVANVRALAPDGVTAVLDNQGRPTIEAGIALGVPTSRINTIADHAAPAELGVTGIGGAEATNPELAGLADLIAAGEVQLPIAEVYPLERLAEAYARLQAGHVRGKVVVVTA